jgi:hypothetical protein
VLLPIAVFVPALVFLFEGESRARASFWLTTQFEGLTDVYAVVAAGLLAHVIWGRDSRSSRQDAVSLGMCACLVAMALSRALVPTGPESMLTEFHHLQFIELVAFFGLSGLACVRRAEAKAVDAKPEAQPELATVTELKPAKDDEKIAA